MSVTCKYFPRRRVPDLLRYLCFAHGMTNTWGVYMPTNLTQSGSSEKVFAKELFHFVPGKFDE